MPKPNYQFEKRKRDMEKKAKKEERRLRKLDPKPAGDATEDGATPAEPTAEATEA